MPNTAATLAPEVTPIISGLANGFPRSCWNVFPAIPNAKPAKIAVSILGRRSVFTVKTALPSTSFKASHTSLGV